MLNKSIYLHKRSILEYFEAQVPSAFHRYAVIYSRNVFIKINANIYFTVQFNLETKEMKNFGLSRAYNLLA